MRLIRIEGAARRLRCIARATIVAIVIALAACEPIPPSAVQDGAPASREALAESDERPPNILLIIADDVGVDQIGAYNEGANPANTPSIDAIARRGVLFRNAWSNPVCSSTRATILTGRYSFRTGVGFVARAGQDLKDREHTLPEVLARHPTARYGSAAFGKWHLNAGKNFEVRKQVLSAPYRAGFSYFRGTFKNITPGYASWQDIVVKDLGSGQVELAGGGLNSAYNTSEIVNHTAAWIRDFELARPSDPWFVWLAFNAAHQPFHKPPASLHSVDLSDPSITCRNPKPFRDPDNLTPCYRAMIEAMDTEIGRLIDRELSKQSLERTTIIFVGDNGSVKGIASDPGRATWGKGTTYEGGINVPLIIAGAGVVGSGNSGAREREDLANTTDLFATILELAGLDPATAVPSVYAAAPAMRNVVGDSASQTETRVILDSVSLTSQLRDDSRVTQGPARQFAYAELFRSGGPDDMWPVSKAIRDTRGWKLIQTYHDADESWREKLFRLDTDPDENTNLLGPTATDESQRAYLRLREQMDAIASSGWSPRGPVEAR